MHKLALIGGELLLADIVLLEVLQGAHGGRHAERVEHGHTLLHDGRDFTAIATHLGLRTA